MSKDETFKSEEDRMQNIQKEKINGLSPEDLLIMKECNRESFWYRCVPFSFAFVGTTQYLTNRGVLKPHPKYGALFKNLAAVLFGFVLGKVSYLGACQQKFLKNDNSAFGQTIRRSKGISINNETENNNYQDESMEKNQLKQKNISSYEQLRAQNRVNYEKQNQSAISTNTPSQYSNISEPSKLRIPGKKNKYGDEVSVDD